MGLRNIASGNGSWLSKLGMFVLAVLVVGPWEGGKRLNNYLFDHVKSWDDGVLYALLAFCGSVGASIGVGAAVKAAGHTALFVPAGFVALIVTAAYISPLVWLGIGNPIWQGVKKVWRGLNTFADAYFAPASAGLVNFFSRILGSSKVWAAVNEPNRTSLLASLVGALCYLSIFVSSGWFGWSIYQFGHAYATGLAGYASTAAGGVLGLFVFATLADLLFKFLEKGKLPALAILVSAPAALVASHFVVGSGLAVAAAAATFVLGIAWVVPGLLYVFSDKLLRWVIDVLTPALKAAYDQPESPSRRLGGQLTNLVSTAAAAYGLFVLSSTIALPLWASVLVIGGFTALAYTLGGKVWDWEGGNTLAGATVSALVGLAAGWFYNASGFAFGMYGAIGSGVLAAMVSFLLAFPLGLIAYQKVTGWVPSITGGISGALVGLHEAVWTRFEKFVEKCENVYTWGYRDKTTKFNDLVLQSSNVVFTFGIPALLYLTFAGFVHAHAIIGWGALGLVGIFTYLLGGKVLVRSGVELDGAIAAIAAGIAAGAYLEPLQPLHYALAGPVGLLIAGLTFFIAYPAVIIGSRKVLDPWATNLLLPALEGLFNAAWKRFGVWWDAFVKVYDALVKLLGRFFSFIFGWLAPYWNSFIALCAAAWRSTFGGGK